MNRVSDQLLPNEHIEYCGKMHPIRVAVCIPWVFFSAVFYAIPSTRVFGIVLILIAGLIVAEAVIDLMTSAFVITNKRIIIRSGLIRRFTLELFHDKIESVSVHQGVVARLGNFGTINVRGVGGTNEGFRGLSSPLEFRRQVQIFAQARPA